MTRKVLAFLSFVIFMVLPLGVDPVGPRLAATEGDRLLSQVTIYRDTYGIPHVLGETEEAAFFGNGYAQGQERGKRIIPTRAWLEMGVPLSLSSDAPTMPWWKPQNVLTAALTRTSASKIVIGPEQRLTIDEAMRAYTMGGAYADFEEHIKGSLEPGKFADLVVWTEDPYVLLPEDLFNNTVDMTMVGGKIVYERT